MFDNITWLVTNKCGLNCKYCNFTNRGIEELDPLTRGKALEFIKALPGSDERFIVLLGGDVLWVPKVVGMVKHLNTLNLPYAFQTSACDASIMEKVLPHLKNLSISVDPCPEGDASRWLKSNMGLYWAGRAKQLNPDIDIHATITIDAKNYKYVMATVRNLSALGIWSETTLVHWKKGDGYDLVGSQEFTHAFKTEHVSDLKVLAEKLVAFKVSGGLVHSSDAFLRTIPQYAVEMDWECSGPVSLVLDVDLSLRLCLHIKGDRVSKWRLWDLTPERWEEFRADWELDKKEQCRGCMWDCSMECELNAGKSWFDHKE